MFLSFPDISSDTTQTRSHTVRIKATLYPLMNFSANNKHSGFALMRLEHSTAGSHPAVFFQLYVSLGNGKYLCVIIYFAC